MNYSMQDEGKCMEDRRLSCETQNPGSWRDMANEKQVALCYAASESLWVWRQRVILKTRPGSGAGNNWLGNGSIMRSIGCSGHFFLQLCASERTVPIILWGN